MQIGVRLHRRSALVIIGYIAFTICGDSQVNATLLAYEGFDYNPASLVLGGAGGTGWSGAWDEVQGPSFASEIEADSLQYSDNLGNILITSGGKLLNTGVDGTSLPGRDLAFRRGDDGTSTWVSFLGQRIGERNSDGEFIGTYQRGAFLALFDLSENSVVTEKINVGENTNVQFPLANGSYEDRWFARAPGVIAGVAVSPFPESNPVNGRLRDVYTDVEFDELSLVVMRIDHLPRNDNLYFWVNPVLNSDPSDASASGHFLAAEIEAAAANLSISPYTDPDGGEFSFNRIRLFSGNTVGTTPHAEWLLDEIRVGTTYADVTPYRVPEPGTMALLIGAAICIGSHNRKRRGDR
jgi:hypothetical protein